MPTFIRPIRARDQYKNVTPTGRPKRKYKPRAKPKNIGFTATMHPDSLTNLRALAAAAGVSVSRYLTDRFAPPPPSVEITA
jgi:hypothetical protein